MNKYLVIGLGSMGKRRVRCLLALGISNADIMGMDIREDRCIESKKKYGIHTYQSEEEIDFSEIRAVIVSLPPDKHFLGASIVQSGKYGKVCNFSYHSGQYLPDWHPWEDIKDFYVSNRATGGAREIVPFELTWLVDTFGFPKAIKGYYRKTMELGCDIEDSYVCAIDYGDMLGSLMVDVVGRNAARNLIINFEKAQLQWRWDNKRIEIYEADTEEWKYIYQEEEIQENGYNINIGENMYIEEVDMFLKGIEDRMVFPNTIDKDIAILQLLVDLEDSDKERK